MNKKKRPQSQVALGTVRIHPRGFGFLQPDDREMYPEDIFIPRHATKGSVDGDYVEVKVNAIVSEKGPEGRVVKVLKRGRSHAAGTIVIAQPKGASFAYLPILGERQLVLVKPHPTRKMTIGDRVNLHILDWGSRNRDPLGEIVTFLGHISDPSCDIDASIQEFGFSQQFPEEVLEEARSFGTEVKDDDWKGRVDLTSLECFTIDPETAKDFDDALSLSFKKGIYSLGVHIADVSHYVTPKSALDNEAKKRCNSIYFPGKVLPMLPHELSSHLCSLKENVLRLTASVLIEFDSEGTLLSYKICRSVIKSQKRFSYEEAKEVLDGKKKSKHSKTLHLMTELCALLKKKRAERGSIEFSMPDIVVEVDALGMPQKVKLVEYDITHQLVEEFMLKANELVATHLSKEGKPLTYRIHEEPNPENIKEFASIAEALGFSIPSEPTTEDLQKLFDDARQSPLGQFLATTFIRSMKLAAYSTQNIGHYGLGLEHYTHFTSPIRRYIDLIVHRVLFDQLDHEDNLDDIALQCSDKERLSSKAENSVIQLKKLRLLDVVYKKDPMKEHIGVVTSVKPFGVVFELVEYLYEGFLPVSELERSSGFGEYFLFDEGEKSFKNQEGGKVFQTGDHLKLRLRSLDLITQQTEWSLIVLTPSKKKKKT